MTPAAAIRDFILESVAGIRNIPPEVATLQGVAFAGVFQIIISEAGRRTREGQSQSQSQSQKKIADALRPIVENILDELDRWFSVAGPPAPRRRKA
jgi:hypothetical protein